MNWNKANRLIFDVICIILIIALPLWILRMIGIEGMVRNEEL